MRGEESWNEILVYEEQQLEDTVNSQTNRIKSLSMPQIPLSNVNTEQENHT